MSTITTDPTSTDKQITVDVPADRLPEFYAFFARFLAGDGPGRRGRRRGPGGHGPGHGPGHRGHGCRGRHEHDAHEHHDAGHEHHHPDAPADTPPAA